MIMRVYQWILQSDWFLGSLEFPYSARSHSNAFVTWKCSTTFVKIFNYTDLPAIK